MPDILVVDDSTSHLESMQQGATKVTRQLGGIVDWANTVDTAKMKLAQRRFDVVVTDVQFENEEPPMDTSGGLEILRYAKTIDPNTIVIVVTDFPNTELAAEAVRKGAFTWIDRDQKRDETLLVREVIVEALHQRSAKISGT